MLSDLDRAVITAAYEWRVYHNAPLLSGWSWPDASAARLAAAVDMRIAALSEPAASRPAPR